MPFLFGFAPVAAATGSPLPASTDCQPGKERRSRDRVFQSPPCRSSAATYGRKWPVAAATTASPHCCIYSGGLLWALLSDGYELRIATNSGQQKNGLRPWVSASGPSHFQLPPLAQLPHKTSGSHPMHDTPYVREQSC